MQSRASTNTPEGFEVRSSTDGYLVLHRRRIGPAWFKGTFYALFASWLVGSLSAAVFLTYHAIATKRAPFWLPALWCICGVVITWFVFGVALKRLRLVTSYTFFPERLSIESTFLTRGRRQSVKRSEVQSVRQVYDGGRIDDLITPSWGLVVDAPRKLTVLFHEEFEMSAWLGPLIAEWAGVSYAACERPTA